MDTHRAPVLVIPGRAVHHEVTLNLWATIMGVVYLLGAPPPNSMASLLPDGWRYWWAAGLVLGGVLALLGSYWLSNLERGLELERAGLVALTGGLLIYTTGVVAFAGLPGLLPAGIAGAWLWANIRRSFVISRDLHFIRTRRGEREG